jgi:hypothetical protein
MSLPRQWLHATTFGPLRDEGFFTFASSFALLDILFMVAMLSEEEYSSPGCGRPWPWPMCPYGPGGGGR